MRENDFCGESKPWYQSTTIISAVATGLVALAGVFNISIGDLREELVEGLVALGVAVGTGVTIYGRVRAKRQIFREKSSDDSGFSGGGGAVLAVLVFLFSMCFLTSCSTTSAGSSTGSSIEKAIPFIRPAVSVTCSTVLNLAVSDSDRVEKASYIYAVAKAVRSLSTGAVPTTEEIKNVIVLWAPDKAHWANLATSIGSIYNSIYPLMQGDGEVAFRVLEAIALGCEDAAGTVSGVN